MADEATIQSQEVQLVAPSFVKAQDYREIYANEVQIGVTPIDVQLSFSRGSAVVGIPQHEIQATVFMSPIEAKAVLLMLGKAVADFETKFGSINLPPQIALGAPAVAIAEKKE